MWLLLKLLENPISLFEIEKLASIMNQSITALFDYYCFMFLLIEYKYKVFKVSKQNINVKLVYISEQIWFGNAASTDRLVLCFAGK